MAENVETRIVKIEIDQTQTLKDLEATEVGILNVKNQQKELNDQLKAGTVTQQEYAASKVQLDQKLKQETDSRKTLTQAINTESNSLAAQKLKLKELVTERDKIDRSTVEGAKKFDDMNKSINTLSGSIKNAEQQGGSFQRNVGNYKGTIDSFTGGAYSAAEGLMGMVRASLAFIATPIGAIIAAIGVALASLMAYFKGSEEGQNKLNAIMAVGGQIMERIMDVVENLGSAVYDAFTNPKQAMIDLFNFLKDNLINRFTAFAVILEGLTELDFKKVANGVIQAGTGIENVVDKVIDVGKEAGKTIDKAVSDGQRLAAMQAKLDKDQRKLVEDSAKRQLQISELRRQSDESEGENKLKYLNEALELEKVSAMEELRIAEQKRDLAFEDAELNGKTKEALDNLAKAEADLNNAKTSFFENTRKMNKERIATEDAINKTIVSRIDNEEKLSQAEEDRVNKGNIKADEELGKALERINKKDSVVDESLQINLDGIAEEEEAERAAAERDYENYKTTEEKKRDEAEKTRDFVIGTVMNTTNVMGDINDKLVATRMHQMAIDLQNNKLHEQERMKVVQDGYDAELLNLEALYKSGTIEKEEYEKRKADADKVYAQKKGEIETDAAKQEDALKRKAFEANKKNRIADAIISVIQSSLQALAQLGPILGSIVAAAALVYGYKQVDLIRQEQYVPGGFSMGGYTGPGGVQDPAGVVHRGEVVWNQRDVAAVGGPNVANSMRPTFRGYMEGGIVASGTTNQIDQQFMNAGQMPSAYLSLKELNDAQNNLSMKVQIVEA